MRAYVESAQTLPPGVPGIMYPTSKTGLAILNRFVSFFGSKPVKNIIHLFTGKNKKAKQEIEIPDYEGLIN